MARYRQIRVPISHPLAKANSTLYKSGLVNVWEHRIVLYDKIGYGPHRCHWCGKSLRWAVGEPAGGNVLAVDHLDSDPRNNDPANLVPSCQGCNKGRAHPHPLVGDDEIFVVREGKRNRATERVCLTCGSTFLVTLSRLRRPNAGRYCSRRCMYARNRKPDHDATPQ